MASHTKEAEPQAFWPWTWPHDKFTVLRTRHGVRMGP